MDHILHKVVGAKTISTMDGFSRYNQIKVLPKDQEKTTFNTPWGTFMYSKIPFGLMNVGATLKRAMYIAFAVEKNKFMVICMDDVMVYYKSDRDHMKHLEKVFLKCRRYGISLNPRNSKFSMKEGKLFGYIISKDAIGIDLDTPNAILKV